MSGDHRAERHSLQNRIRVAFARRSQQNDAESCYLIDGTATLQLHSNAVTRFVNKLSCIRCSTGENALNQLIQALLNRDIARYDVAQCLLDPDGLGEIESGAPLCNLARLLQLGHVAICDLDREKFRTRAVHELSSSINATSSTQHVHEPNCRGVVEALEALLGTGRSAARDAVLQAMVQSILTPEDGRAENLEIVPVVLDAVESMMQPRERMFHFAKWARSALLQPSATSGFNESTEYWSTELRNLAVSLNATEHLYHRDAEAKVLDGLFARLDTENTASLLSEILNKLTCSGMSFVNFRFGRICLVFRGCMKHHEKDKTLVPSVTQMLLSTICSVKSANSPENGRLHAIAITLARFFFSIADTESRALLAYEKWFLSVLKTAEKQCVKLLMDVLVPLVPNDPVRYLSIQSRCCSRVPSWKEIVIDYRALAKTRVKDLEPEGPKAQPTKKAMEDLCKYLVEFHRNKDKSVPQGLVRTMNFRRFIFRESILPLLMSDSLDVPQSLLRDDFATGGLDMFDKARIELIKVLAYERADKAIRRSEADESIPKIEAAIRKRRERVTAGGGLLPNGNNVIRTDSLPEDSSILIVFERFCDLAALGSNASIGDGSQVSDFEKVERLLVSKCLALENQAEAACTILQLISDRVRTVVTRCKNSEDLVNGHQDSSRLEYDSYRSEHRLLWSSCSEWILAMVRFCSRVDMTLIWNQVLLQSFACICIQPSKVGAAQVFAIAMLHYAVVRFSDERPQRAMSYFHEEGRLTHIVEATIDHAQLSRPSAMLTIMRYSTAYSMLVLANGSQVQFRPFPIPNRGTDGTYFWQDDYSEAASIVPAALCSLVRWSLMSYWRLNSIGSNIRIEPDPSSHESLSAVNFAVATVHALDVAACNVLKVEDWTRFEARSKWGTPERVAECVAAFEKVDGDALSATVVEIARICLQSSLPSWIVLGTAAHIRTGGAQSAHGLAQSVDKCIEAEQLQLAGAILRVAMHLPPKAYFHSMTVPEACSHLSALAALSWPHDNALIWFLLEAISTCTDEQAGGSRAPCTIIASAAYYASNNPQLYNVVEKLPIEWYTLRDGVRACRAVARTNTWSAQARSRANGTQLTQSQPTQAASAQSYPDASALLLVHIASQDECIAPVRSLGQMALRALDSAIDTATLKPNIKTINRLLRTKHKLSNSNLAITKTLDISPCDVPNHVRRIRIALGRQCSRKRSRDPRAHTNGCVTARARLAAALFGTTLPRGVIGSLVRVLVDLSAYERRRGPFASGCGACPCSCACATLNRGELAKYYSTVHGMVITLLDRGDPVDEETRRNLRGYVPTLCSRIRA